jgi:hypothetical protein
MGRGPGQSGACVRGYTSENQAAASRSTPGGLTSSRGVPGGNSAQRLCPGVGQVGVGGQSGDAVGASRQWRCVAVR